MEGVGRGWGFVNRTVIILLPYLCLAAASTVRAWVAFPSIMSIISGPIFFSSVSLPVAVIRNRNRRNEPVSRVQACELCVALPRIKSSRAQLFGGRRQVRAQRLSLSLTWFRGRDRVGLYRRQRRRWHVGGMGGRFRTGARWGSPESGLLQHFCEDRRKT